MRRIAVQTWIIYVLVVLLLLVAYFLRLEHLLARVFHIDEFISMLAAQMTAEKGAPIFPSGLFYGHGLLISYVSAPFIRLFAFSEEVARWPSLLIGMVAVASFLLVGSRLLKSKAVGLFALPLLRWTSR
jgi:predicted membrane-bound mannosyltransferase